MEIYPNLRINLVFMPFQKAFIPPYLCFFFYLLPTLNILCLWKLNLLVRIRIETNADLQTALRCEQTTLTLQLHIRPIYRIPYHSADIRRGATVLCLSSFVKDDFLCFFSSVLEPSLPAKNLLEVSNIVLKMWKNTFCVFKSIFKKTVN